MNLLLIILAISAFSYFIFQLISWIFGAGFESTRRKQLQSIIKFANPKYNEKIADLGSGSGKILLALKDSKAELHGYEINPILILLSKLKTRKIKNIHIHWKNLWKADLSRFSTIIIFQFFHLMPKLEKKILKECNPGTKIISNTWKFPNLQPVKQEGKVRLYIIQK